MTAASARFLIIVAIVGGLLSCSKDAPPPVAATTSATVQGKPSLVLITLEATRADHLGCYGDTEAQTPNLDQLAREGTYFSKAIAVAPLTLPSTASILTGLYPPKHKLRGESGSFVAGATLAEQLKAQGYATAAAVGARRLGGASGFNRGFDSYAQSKDTSRTARVVVDDAIAAVDRMKGGAFFLWVQFDDPRAPYTPPPDFRARFANRSYDGEIASVDAELGRLLGALRASGNFDGTVVAATADHGESLGEHGEDTHGLFVYDATIKVPLIVRYPPRIPAGAKFDQLVSGVDLAPTLLELMDLPPLSGAQGVSCAALLRGGNAPVRAAVYSESLLGAQAYGWVPLHAVRTTVDKFVDAPEPERYNVKRDPSETINLAPDDPAAVKSTWRKSLDAIFREAGVVGSEAATSQHPGKARRDVNSLVAAHNLCVSAEAAMEDGNPELAAPLLRQALAKDDGNPAATSLLANIRAGASAAPSASDGSFAGQLRLGMTLRAAGEFVGAATAFRDALALEPNSAEAHYALGTVLADQGDRTGAAAQLRAAVTANPKLAEGWNQLGIVLEKSKRRPEAIAAYNGALEAVPDHADALFNRAKLELLENQPADARRDLDRLLAVHADYPAARFLEAHVCLAEKNTAGAKDALTKFLAIPDADARMKAVAADMLKKF